MARVTRKASNDGGYSGSGSIDKKSVLGLGYGPISAKTLAGKVSSGDVKVSSGGKVSKTSAGNSYSKVKKNTLSGAKSSVTKGSTSGITKLPYSGGAAKAQKLPYTPTAKPKMTPLASTSSSSGKTASRSKKLY